MEAPNQVIEANSHRENNPNKLQGRIRIRIKLVIDLRLGNRNKVSQQEEVYLAEEHQEVSVEEAPTVADEDNLLATLFNLMPTCVCRLIVFCKENPKAITNQIKLFCYLSLLI